MKVSKVWLCRHVWRADASIGHWVCTKCPKKHYIGKGIPRGRIS